MVFLGLWHAPLSRLLATFHVASWSKVLIRAANADFYVVLECNSGRRRFEISLSLLVVGLEHGIILVEPLALAFWTAAVLCRFQLRTAIKPFNISNQRTMILLLLGEKAGMRAS
jgi:hypothetical protein